MANIKISGLPSVTTPMVAGITAALGLTDAEVDDLFVAAAQIQV